MIRGLILKSFSEVWRATLLFTLGLMAFEGLVIYVLAEFQITLAGQLMQVRFIQTFVRGLLGTDVGQDFGPTFAYALVWVHPIVLALLWGHEITLCTRVPAGEVDRGTIDLLLGLPVTRWQLYLAESVVWLLTGAGLILAGLAGFMFGTRVAGTEPQPDLARMGIVVLNFFCLYVSVGGLAMLLSAISDRKGRAVAGAFSVLLASFLLNFLASLWEPADRVSFLSVLTYYRPVDVLRYGAWPAADMAVLGSVGGIFWLAGGVIFNRRDICTV